MSLLESYLAAVVPTPYRVFGRLLRPYSLGHALLLQRIDSPYAIDGDVEAGLDDLLIALIVCGNTFADGQRLLASPGELRSELAAWQRPLRRWCRPIPIDPAEAQETFAEYLAEGRAYPKLWRQAGGGNGPAYTAPWQERIRLTLGRYGYSADDVMDMHLPALWYAFHTIRELEMFEHAKSARDILPVFPTAEFEEYVERDRAARAAIKN